MENIFFIKLNIILKFLTFLLILLSSFVVSLISSFFSKKYNLKLPLKNFYFAFSSISSIIVFPSIYHKDSFEWLIYFSGISSCFLIYFLILLERRVFRR